MPPTDEIWRWSDELARDPTSFVFLQLGEALRRQGELVLALKIALRGLERHPHDAEAQALVARIVADREVTVRSPVSMVRASPPERRGGVVAPAVRGAEHETLIAEADASRLDGTQAILIDAQGLVIAGTHRDDAGKDIAPALAAELSGVADEARRAARHLNLGAWRSIVVEADGAVVAMGPVGVTSLTVVTAPPRMPLGMIRRVLARCSERAFEWIGATR